QPRAGVGTLLGNVGSCNADDARSGARSDIGQGLLPARSSTTCSNRVGVAETRLDEQLAVFSFRIDLRRRLRLGGHGNDGTNELDEHAQSEQSQRQGGHEDAFDPSFHLSSFLDFRDSTSARTRPSTARDSFSVTANYSE